MQTLPAPIEQMPPIAVHPERDFDRLAEIAASLCRTPIAFISIVSENEMWFKARIGFDIDRIPRNMSFCDAVALTGQPVVVPNLLDDERTCCNPLIEAEGVRFYAGHPILDGDGHMLGTVCVLDHEPRPDGLSPSEYMGMAAIAEQAGTLIQMRSEAHRRQKALETHQIVRIHDRRRIARLSALVHLGDRLRDAGDENEAFAIAGEALGMALDAEQAGYVDIDETTGVAHVIEDWHKDGIPSLNGIHRSDGRGIMDAMPPEPHADHAAIPGRKGLHSRLRAPVVQRGHILGFVYAIDQDDRPWMAEDLEFARGVADRVQETVLRMRSQADRDILAGEIGHRLKNVMAVTRAIVMQTLMNRVDPDLSRVLDERLSAYSSAHDLLLTGEAGEAPIHLTVQTVLQRLATHDRVLVEGPEIDLNDRTTLALSLLVNELATNAIKHGSLSRAEGVVRMTWTCEDDQLTICWREIGGPPAREPTRRGFGSRILHIGLHRVGGTELRYEPLGLTATFRAPMKSILA